MAAEEQAKGARKGQAEKQVEEPAEEIGYAAAQLVVYICACGCLPAYIYECAWVCVALCKAKHALSVALFGRGHKNNYAACHKIHFTVKTRTHTTTNSHPHTHTIFLNKFIK